jgi:ubiquinone biosynthesis protein COQ4
MSFNYVNQIASPENLEKFGELVKIAAGAGQNVTDAFKINDRLLNTNSMNLCVRLIMNDPASAAIIKERYIGAEYNLEEMLKMPKHSLGWTYATIMSTLGYDPQFYPSPKLEMTDAEYISFRVFKTHDIHHILTGFSLNNFGELGVISLTVSQSRFPGFLFIDLLSLMISFFTADKLSSEAEIPEEEVKTLKYKFDLISQGLHMGESAKSLFPIKWEENFERPLNEIREELNINPSTTGIYSWYTNPILKNAIS